MDQDRAPATQLHLDELAGTPLTDIRTIVELIASTKTKAGLTVQANYNPNWYPTGQKASKQEFDAILLHRHDWQGDWNYTITPAA